MMCECSDWQGGSVYVCVYVVVMVMSVILPALVSHYGMIVVHFVATISPPLIKFE